MLIISFLINLIGVYFIGKRIYYYNQPKQETPVESNKITYYLNRQTVYDMFPSTKNDIVFAGDSHTQNFATGDYLKGYLIRNRGINGDISAGLLKRVGELTNGGPKKIFIEIGFNDVWHKIKPDSTIKNIQLIVGKIKKQSPRSKIYILNVFPTANTNMNGVNPQNIIPELNKKLVAFCNSNDIAVVDLYSKLSDNGSLNKEYDCGDGVHLNGKGYSLWSSTIKAYL